MEIAVIGHGILGAATGEGFKRLGHKITYYDKNDKPVLGKVTFVCTPESVVPEILEKFTPAQDCFTICVRSTVPIGTCRQFEHVSHNPEFLRESVSQYEFMNPTHIVLGQCCPTHGDVLAELYRSFNVPIIRTNPTTSEMVKLANNAYLATQISFWNQIKLIADKYGVNSHIVGKICSLDPRITEYGSSLHGLNFSGKCLPKDTAQLKLAGMKAGATTCLLDAVQEINNFMQVKGKEE